MKLTSFPDHLIPKISQELPYGYPDSVKKELDEILTMHSESQKAIEKQLKKIKKGEIYDQAVSRVLVEGFTIDQEKSKDLDDGIYIEKTKNGNYLLQVSISDPSEYIPILSAIDLEALNKGTSIYLGESNDDIIYMIPEILATDVCSLNHQEKRLTLTFEALYDNQMNVIDFRIFESIFYNRFRFNHDNFQEHFFYDDLDYNKDLRLLYEFQQKISKKRAKHNIENFNDSERTIGKKANKSNIASSIIQDCMASVNIETSKYQKENFPESIGVYRNHMPGLKGKKRIPKNHERAYYSSNMLFHYGLNYDFYTHATSPMRRYADLILHRLIKAQLRGEEMPYTEKDLRKIMKYLNMQLARVILLERMYHFGNNMVKKELYNTDGSLITSRQKDSIKYSVKESIKLPKEVEKNIIDIIRNSQKRGDWMWIFGTYIISREKNIKAELKKRMEDEVRNGNVNYKKFLNAILDTKLISGKGNKIFEKNTNPDGSFDIYLKHKKLGDPKKRKKVIIVKGALDAEDAMQQLFSYKGI